MRTVALIGWLALLAAQFLFAPPPPEDTMGWVTTIMMGDFTGEEPLIVAEFMLMGVWPLVLAIQLRGSLRAKPAPAWPFLLGSCVLGCFVLAPWFFFNSKGSGEVGKVGAFLGSTAVRAVAAVMAFGWLSWGLVAGNAGAFAEAFGSNAFIFVMSIDFLVFWLISGALRWQQVGPNALSFVPFVGGLIGDNA